MPWSNSVIGATSMKTNLSILRNSESAGIKTDKTDKIDFINLSNEKFIYEIFGNMVEEDCPIVVTFPGTPASVNKSQWFGKPWLSTTTDLAVDHNNYVSFATFKPDAQGIYRRQKKHFSSLYAVMLDDIGGKIPAERITLKPSWKIETSPNNFQIGFILNEPITDAVLADNLMKSIIEAGLTDPGASGPCSRLGRLPVGINGKCAIDDGSAWQCRLIIWQPGLRYTSQELLDGLGLVLKVTAQPSRAKNRTNNAGDPYLDNVYIPRAGENPVIASLKSLGLYKHPLGDGRHDITCPWF